MHDLYVGTRMAALCQGGQAIFVAAVNDTDAALAALSPPLAKLGGRSKLRIWLSGGLCRPFIVPAVPGIRGTVEWQRTAAALAPQRTGLAGPCRVWSMP